MGTRSALAQQIAELEDPAPRDFDPEEEGANQSSDEGSNSQASDDDLVGTEHYVEVGKSKLRKADEVALGPQYEGSRISRKTLQEASDESDLDYEDARESIDSESFADPEADNLDVDEEDGDIDSDNAFTESDAEKFKDFTFRSSSKPLKANGFSQRSTAADFMKAGEDEEEEEDTEEELGDYDDKDPGINDDEEKSSDMDFDEDEEDDDEYESSSEEDGDERAELRKLMNEEKSVVATISHAVKADVEKGNAIKKQRQIFDSLLNIRIRLQKALVATNSMVSIEKEDDVAQPYQAAEDAAINLLNTLDSMRNELERASGPANAGTKRKRALDVELPSSVIWERIQESESTAVPTRKAILGKWSSMIHGRNAVPVPRKLNTASKSTIIDVLQEQLFNPERLVKRTRIPRSCAPLQVQQKITEDPNIYDDAVFYQLLLKELVDQRMIASSTTAVSIGGGGQPISQWSAVREAKTRKNVDTKASKGRKMRFTVHEKLQNFMAPEDRGSWEQDAVDRLFGTLLGQKMSLGEEDGHPSEDEHSLGDRDGGLPVAEEALMLFRS